MATIIQKIVFSQTTCDELYNLYMNTEQHSMITNGPVTISETAGSEFEAFGGYITGKTLMTISNKLIVQEWCGSDWGESADSSAFVLSFDQDGNDAVMNVIHANVPDEHAAHLDTGWYGHYWNPWKQHLAGEPITRPEE